MNSKKFNIIPTPKKANIFEGIFSFNAVWTKDEELQNQLKSLCYFAKKNLQRGA